MTPVKARPAPLLTAQAKHPAAVALGRLSHAGEHEAVLAKMAAMRRELGMTQWRGAR